VSGGNVPHFGGNVPHFRRPPFSQGNPDQPDYTLSRRYEVCQGDSRSLRSLNGDGKVSGSAGIQAETTGPGWRIG